MARVVDKKASKADGGKKREEQSQFIIDLTIADWEHMKELVEPSDCKMKHRWEALGGWVGGKLGRADLLPTSCGGVGELPVVIAIAVSKCINYAE